MEKRSSSEQESADKSDRGEIIGLNGDAAQGNIYAEIAAQINQYTDRPDLVLETIEKYDPGFIKSMNVDARAFSKKYRESRFAFGRFQAYASAIAAIIAVIGIFILMYILTISDRLNFWNIVGLAMFYAITQSGPSGFLEVVKQIETCKSERSRERFVSTS